MLKRLRRSAQAAFLFVERGFDRAFGPALNPFAQLGSLSFFFYWIVAVTGIYLFVVFDTSVAGAYPSVERLTVEQWYLGGVMRSLHRYASDAMVITALVHLVREYVFDRYRGVRFFTWVTGVPILWLLFASGITGYWLVWDQLAQFIAVVTTEWLDWLPIFGEPIARNFLTEGAINDRFFTLLVFMHIAAPLFLLFAMWIHILRMARPKVNPPRVLAGGTMIVLVAVSFYKPALSQPPADLSTVPAVVGLDWFYLGLYPLLDLWPPGATWALALGATAVLAALPWLPPARRPATAEVDLDNCNGCARCFADCPFEAITMQPRSDGKPYLQEAVVNPDLCTSCGICVGACPSSTPFRKAVELVTGIDLPDRSLHALREATEEGMERLRAAHDRGEPTVVVYGCDYGPEVAACDSDSVAAFSLPCIGMLPPPFIDFVLARGPVDGVMLTGCRESNCFNRLGIQWTNQRIAGERDPYLRDRVPRERIARVWTAWTQTADLKAELAAFRDHLARLAEAESADEDEDARARRRGDSSGSEAGEARAGE